MGLPMRNQNIQIITLIIEGTTDEIGALTGKLGTVGSASQINVS